MCDHGFYCDHCPDHFGELVMMKQRCEHYRLGFLEYERQLEKLRKRRNQDADYVVDIERRYDGLKKDHQHLQDAQCLVKRNNKELKKTIAFLLQKQKSIDQMDAQLDKLQALNTHLATTATVSKRELIKMQEANQHITHVAMTLEAQCQIFVELYKRASEDETMRTKLRAIMDTIEDGKFNALLAQ